MPSKWLDKHRWAREEWENKTKLDDVKNIQWIAWIPGWGREWVTSFVAPWWIHGDAGLQGHSVRFPTRSLRVRKTPRCGRVSVSTSSAAHCNCFISGRLGGHGEYISGRSKLIDAFYEGWMQFVQLNHATGTKVVVDQQCSLFLVIFRSDYKCRWWICLQHFFGLELGITQTALCLCAVAPFDNSQKTCIFHFHSYVLFSFPQL